MLASKGKCAFCDKMVSRSQVKKHLSGHLIEMEAQQKSNNMSVFLRVTAAEMFLYILMDSEETLRSLDRLLRGVWLECCGHMSSFQELEKRYQNDWDDMDKDIGEDQRQSVGQVLEPGKKFSYDYDFGSTTQLDIEILDTYQVNTRYGLLLLTRNEPLKIMCQVCEANPAEFICAVCWGEHNMFCKKCAKAHAKTCSDFADYAKMPIVNSPRMGVCAYTGGKIDQSRDGIWQPDLL